MEGGTAGKGKRGRRMTGGAARRRGRLMCADGGIWEEGWKLLARADSELRDIPGASGTGNEER